MLPADLANGQERKVHLDECYGSNWLQWSAAGGSAAGDTTAGRTGDASVCSSDRARSSCCVRLPGGGGGTTGRDVNSAKVRGSLTWRGEVPWWLSRFGAAPSTRGLFGALPGRKPVSDSWAKRAVPWRYENGGHGCASGLYPAEFLVSRRVHRAWLRPSQRQVTTPVITTSLHVRCSSAGPNRWSSRHPGTANERDFANRRRRWHITL